MIECQWCDMPLAGKYQRHLESCFMKQKGITMRQKYEKILCNKNFETVNEENLSLKAQLTSLNQLTINLQEELKKARETLNIICQTVKEYDSVKTAINPSEILSRKIIADSTMQAYRNTLKKFYHYYNSNEHPLTIETVTKYLHYLISQKKEKGKTDTCTIIKERSHLLSLLKETYPHLTIALPKIKKVILQKKFTMERKHFDQWLEDNRGTEIGVMSLLMVFYALRVNVVLNLKRSHFDDNLEYVRFFDSKTDSVFSKKIPKIIRKVMKPLINIRSQNDFIFFPNVKNRGSINRLFNKKLAESDVFPRDGRFKFTTHIFRRYSARCAKTGVKRAQHLLGHSHWRVTSDYYLN